jgi:hypothetical protein
MLRPRVTRKLQVVRVGSVRARWSEHLLSWFDVASHPDLSVVTDFPVVVCGIPPRWMSGVITRGKVYCGVGVVLRVVDAGILPLRLFRPVSDYCSDARSYCACKLPRPHPCQVRLVLTLVGARVWHVYVYRRI